MSWKNDVVLVTTTFSMSMDDIRVSLALKTCRAAREHGYKMIVVDGSPCEEFKAALRETGAQVLDQQEPGMGQSRRECMKAGLASDAQVLVWLEPEKYPLVSLLASCIQPVVDGEAKLVIPRRESLASYPRFQQWSEELGNLILGKITRRPDLDFYSGPRIMDRETAGIMSKYDGTALGQKMYGDSWHILFIPVLWFLHDGFLVKSVTVPYEHPPEQTAAEATHEWNLKREKQLRELVEDMMSEDQRLRGKKSV